MRGAWVVVVVGALGAACSKKAEVTPTADTRGADPAASVSPSESAVPSSAPTAASGDVGAADSKAERKLGPEDEKRFLKAMAEARKLHEKKDYEGALKGFQGALGIAPDDPRALSELGWAAFFLKDLELAEASTKKALERASEAYLKASAYYNLGRIQEERGQRDDAVASYKKSLELKMSSTVKERLAKLDAALASAFEVLGMTAMLGPFISLEAFCDDHKKRALPEKVRCDSKADSLGDAYKGPTRVAKPGAPYKAVRMIGSSRATAPGADPPDLGEGKTEAHLTLWTKVGWFVLEGAAATNNPGADGITESLEVKELAVRDAVPGGAAEVFLRAVHYRGDSNMSENELEEYTNESLTVCGVGPSDKPSCTKAIRLSWIERVGVISPEMDEPGMKHDLRDKKGSLTASFLPDGQLEIKAGGGELPEALKGLPGTHALKFP